MTITAASVTLAIRRDEGNDIFTLYGTTLNVANAIELTCSLPSTIGRCVLLEALMFTEGREATGELASATAVEGLELGALALIVDGAGTLLAPVGLGVMRTSHMDTADFGDWKYAAHISPDNPVPWGAGENLRLYGPRVDTNVSPTIDWSVLCRVRVMNV